jgi:hypothetical protein
MGHAVGPGPSEKEPRAQHSENEIHGRAGIEGSHQREIELLAEVQAGDAREQETGNGELLREDHQPVDRRVGEELAPDREVTGPDQEEDRRTTLRMPIIGCGQTS